MKKLAVVVIVWFAALNAFGQPLNNEWIDYTKTYYKFKVGANGLYRINNAQLVSTGLEGQPAQNFQLWRNGKEVPLFTSAASGALGVNGYIEFWGVKNDGVPDRALYRNPNHQLNDKVSLLTDTAAYFLTINPTGNNLRFAATANNVTGNTLPAEPYFIHTLRHNFMDRINRGRALVAGSEYVYSSSYDEGEWWSSLEIYPASPVSVIFEKLFVAPSGPAATFKNSIAGTARNNRSYKIELNNTTVVDTAIQQFSAAINTNNAVPLSLLHSNNAGFKISNTSAEITDRVVVGFLELNYPRQFNFSNAPNFNFTMAASAASKYLEITNFNHGGSAPVLYDLTNNRRYVTELSAGVVKVVLQPSSVPVNLVLVSAATSNANVVSQFVQRNFIRYAAPEQQGDYLVISHSSLQVPFSGANQVEQYKAYRSSIAGGSYNAKIIDIDQLVDQFSYGIKKSPLSVKNFLRYARSSFSTAPKFALIIGRGLSYAEYRPNEMNPQAERLNLVPTFGYPASDVLLASNNLDPIMNTFIGRVSALTPQEVFDYLDKIKQYEQAQKFSCATVADKAWMKNVVHVVGAGDQLLSDRIERYMANYTRVISDTFYGGNVVTFSKNSTGPVTTITNALMDQMWQKGMSLLTYFGHSSASSLDYNLDDPYAYNNAGKYPVFLVNGCNAGNLYAFDTGRFTILNTLSERFVLAKNRGSIGFIASTHFGLENYLDYYTNGLYRSFSQTGYNKSLGYNIDEAIRSLLVVVGSDDFAGRLHAEQTALHGDPAIKLNAFDKPDFVAEEAQIVINPNIVSVADLQFKVKAYLYNIGKATGDSVRVQIKRQYPDGTETVLYHRKIRSVRYIDSVSINIPIVASRDRGENKIIVSVDTESRYDELCETNNTATKSFVILDNELRPVYPYDFAIVDKPIIKLVASTANPIATSRQYVMEIDTTELFNSSSKIIRTVTSGGGVVEFDPAFSFTDSTVYYWRVAPVPTAGPYLWNSSSFVYLAGTEVGYNQSHFFQHKKSATERITLDSAGRRWNFNSKTNRFTIINSIIRHSGDEDNHFSISVNGNVDIASACLGHSIIFNVFDPVTLKPYYNQPQPSTIRTGPLGNFLGSANNCNNKREFNFEYSYMDTTGRRKMRDFLDWVPSNAIVTVRLILDEPFDQTPYANAWRNDRNVYGQGNTAYDRLYGAGFVDIDSFNRPRTFAFMYKKNNASFAPVSKFSEGLFDRLTMNVDVSSPDTLGYVTSPRFGPAAAWKQVKWRGRSLETTPGDDVRITVIGITSTGREDTLYRLPMSQQDLDISAVDPVQYPYMRLHMKNQDSISLTPYQLRYWRLYYTPVPEGGLASNSQSFTRDTFDVGETFTFGIDFKNVSGIKFRDSMTINMVVLDKNNVPNVIPVQKRKILNVGDTINVSTTINTTNYTGNNTLFLDVNPNFVQPEQQRFNNILYKNFFVRGDTHNPLLDVTFDGVHILNGDIVSAKPKIVIKLKDEAKFLALNDTSLTTVMVRYPNGNLRRFKFDSDTLRFINADLSTGKNEATIEFSPSLLEDSGTDFYELIVRGKDRSGNNTGTAEYTVRFQVINKPMISNMFNYPNPFTTSTAFVFTLTGSQIPQNLRIQIMTVTGKIVKEITKQELGDLRIGRNITDYKWDGTDQYGQKLGNGIYLYRVITNHNGNKLEKFNTVDAIGDKVNTDQYFNKGYGKMYLMR
ncbi:MAG: hypothetical protein JWQ96_3349 [Segetibacter sp.]|nr:hypothetical protein [Segetibacter sp.]